MKTFVPPLKLPYTITMTHGEIYDFGPLKGQRHKGVDMLKRSGSKCFAPASGVIEYVGPHSQGGNIIIINHGLFQHGSLYSWMAHFSKMHVDIGQHVSQGQHIANVGSEGWSSAPHLHWHLYINDNVWGELIDPLPLTLTEQEMMDLEKEINDINSKLYFTDLRQAEDKGLVYVHPRFKNAKYKDFAGALNNRYSGQPLLNKADENKLIKDGWILLDTLK